MRHKSRTMLAALIAVFAATALTAVPALASGKPFVETKPATSIGETTATLNGVVNPNGATTKYYFDYGTTVSYGKKTTEVSVGSGTGNLEESKAITALTANTSYHFRIVATNSNGTTDGADQVFSTTGKPVPPEFVLPKGETFPVKFESGVTNEQVGFDTVDFELPICRTAKLKGEVTSAKKASVADEMTGCESGGGSQCNTRGSASGVVVMPGGASVVYLNKTKKEVGILLEVTPLTIYCGSAEVFVKGALLSPITPINTKTTAYETHYTNVSRLAPHEEFTHYENEKGETIKTSFQMNLWGSGWEEAGYEVQGAIKLTMAKALTLSA